MVRALLFDVFGTVVDWRLGVAREVEVFCSARGLAVDSTDFADAWRARYQPAMEEIRSGGRGYTALDVLHRENLDATLSEFGLGASIDAASRDELNRAWEKLPPWPDSVAGLAALKKVYAIAPCSNGSIALMTWLAKYGGLPWDAILGAEVARAYKPQPEVYLASAAALDLVPHEVMMVAAHQGDLLAAAKQGLRTAFVKRPLERGVNGKVDTTPDPSFDFVADDFRDLATQLGV